jgi:amino acid transporter
VTPGINTALMLLLATIASIPVVISYAALGSAMPRAGGDYLYDSRCISPLIGFSIPFAWAAILWTIFYPLSAFVIVQYGVIPVLNAANIAMFDSWVTWLSSTTGSFVSTVVLSILAWALTIWGVRVYRIVQRGFFIPAIVITNLVLLVQFLSTSSSSFQAKFDAFAANRAADLTYDGILSLARAQGWTPPSFSWGDTLLWVPIMMGVIPFAVFATEGMLGEVKQARNFVRLTRALIIGALYIGAFVFALLYFLFERAASREFISALAFDTNNGLISPSYAVNITTVSAMMNDNFWVVLGIAVGFVASAFQLMTGILMNLTRVFVSMALDRSLPQKFGDVSERFHTPVFAATCYLALVVGTSAWFTYSTKWFTAFSYVAAISGEGILLFGCIAAFLMPIRARAIYEVSPVSRYRIAGVPLVSVMGALGTLILAVSWVVIMTNDKLGVTGAGLGLPADPRLLVIVPVVIAVILFFAWQRVEKARGIDTSLAFQTVPPE